MHSLQSIRNINHWAATSAAAQLARTQPEACVRYEGHNADGSSIQKHSSGSAYPYVVAQQGDGASLRTTVSYGGVTVTLRGAPSAGFSLAGIAKRVKAGNAALNHEQALVIAARQTGGSVEAYADTMVGVN